MCCCDKPTINGELGYKWNDPNGPSGKYPVNAPDLSEGDNLLFDEPGRCGGEDSHSYHYRLVNSWGGVALLVRHGAGDERIPYISNGKAIISTFKSLDSCGRYWLMNAIYHAHKRAKQNGAGRMDEKWRQAAAEKRIKTRKIRGSERVKVWIEQEAQHAD